MSGGSQSPLADDLLWGAAAIAKELGVSRRRALHYLEHGQIPAKKVGEIWVASRQRLRERLVGEAA